MIVCQSLVNLNELLKNHTFPHKTRILMFIPDEIKSRHVGKHFKYMATQLNVQPTFIISPAWIYHVANVY